MNETYVFLDTNILLHYKFVDQVDWPKIVTAQHVTAVLAPVVIRELDRHKDMHTNKRLRKRAGTVIARLDALIENGNPAPVRSGLELLLIANEPDIDFAAHQLRSDVQDDHLIASVLAYRRDYTEARILLGTADLGLKIKARHHGIELLIPPAELRLAEETDPDQEQLKALQQELRQLKQAVPSLNLRFADGSERLNWRLGPETPLPVDDIDKQIVTLKKQHPLRPLPTQDLYDPSMARISEVLSSLSLAANGKPTSHEIQTYNNSLREFYDLYRLHLAEIFRHHLQPERTIELELVLHNDGTSPGEDIDLFLHFPDGFEMYDEDGLPEPPEPPDAPQTPEEKRSLQWEPLTPTFYLPSLDNIRPIGPRPNVSSPKIRRTNSYDVQWHVDSLKHSLTISFDPLFVVYKTVAEAASFTIDYRINAGNVPQEKKGQLHVIIERRN